MYLCLLGAAAGKPIDPANIYEIGPLFLSVSQAVLRAGCTPILAHHAKKLIPIGDPIGLEDLAYAGVAEFARQWVLLNPREAFDPDTGTHQLWMTFGGSMGQGGVFGVDVVEGILDDDFGGRGWEVAVSPQAELRARGAEAEATAKERHQRDQVQADGSRLLAALDKLAIDGPAVYTQVRAAALLSGDRMTRAVLDLIERGVIEETAAVTAVGKGKTVKKEVKGLRRRGKRLTGLTGQNGFVPQVPTVAD